MNSLAIHSISIACLLATACATVSVRAAATINPVNKHAYGANVGWVNMEGDVTNGVAVGELSCSGFAYGANVGWIHFGNGPLDGHQYSNGSAVDFGVNVQPDGALQGYAYGANIGWINFEANGAPRINLLDGIFSGSAYGANVGWISLSNLSAFVQTDSLDPGPDTDLDMFPDAWELWYATNLTVLTTSGDLDGDVMTDKDEYLAGTDPDDIGSLLAITALDLIPGLTNSDVTWQSVATRLYEIHLNADLTNDTTWLDSGLVSRLPTPGARPHGRFRWAARTRKTSASTPSARSRRRNGGRGRGSRGRSPHQLESFRLWLNREGRASPRAETQPDREIIHVWAHRLQGMAKCPSGPIPPRVFISDLAN